MTKSEDKKLLAIWKQKVFENAIWKCEISGQTPPAVQLHCHHYFGRRNRATRYYIPNGILLAALYHTMGIQSAHENPKWFRGKMLNVRGKKWLTDLIRQSNKTFKGTYETVLEYLEGKTLNYC